MRTTNDTAMPETAEAGQRPVTRVHSPGLDVLNAREMQAIENLFAWVAEEQDTARETVRSITEARFGADDVAGIERKDYDEVIRFLVDLRGDELRN